MTINILNSAVPVTSSHSITLSTGTNRCLWVCASVTPTVGGLSMTRATSGFSNYDWFYYINPPTGSQTVSVSSGVIYSIVQTDNTNPTIPINTANISSAGGTNPYSFFYSFTLGTSYPVTGRVLGHITNVPIGAYTGATTIANNGNNILADFGSYNGAGIAVSGAVSSSMAINSFFVINEIYPSISTGENVTSIKYNSATLNSNVNGRGYANTSYFKYGTTGSYGTNTTSTSLGTGVNSLSASISGLSANTTYHYATYSNNTNGEYTSSDFTFTTLPTPTTTTSSASNITSTTATLNGFITNGNVAGTHYFQYGIATGVYTNTTASTSNTASASQQSISANLTGLTTSVPIYYRSVLIVDGITYYSSEMTFTPGNSPIISLGSISALTDTTVTLNGTVNPGGLSTNYQFNYGTTTSLGSSTALTSAGSGTSDVSVNAPLTGLAQNTTYYYQLTAVNSSGTNNTSIASFTTNGDPVINSFTVTDSVVYTENTFNFNVDVNDTSATYQIDYGTAPNTYTLQATGTLTSDGTTSKDVLSLTPNSTYYAKLTITNSFGTAISSEISFSTFASPFTTTWTNTDTEPTTTWTNTN